MQWAPQNQAWICIAEHFPLLLFPKLSAQFTLHLSRLAGCLYCQHYPLKAPMPLVLSIFPLATNFWGRIPWQDITSFVCYPTSAVLHEEPGLPWKLETQTHLQFLCICTDTTPSSRSAWVPPHAKRGTNSIGKSIWLPVGPLCVSPWAIPFIGLVSHPLLLLPQFAKINGLWDCKLPPSPKSKPTTLKRKSSGKQWRDGGREAMTDRVPWDFHYPHLESFQVPRGCLCPASMVWCQFLVQLRKWMSDPLK